MALGGGTFSAMNKVLPGSYINFVAKAKGISAHDRGVAAIGLILDWGPDDTIIKVSVDELNKVCRKYFGYDIDNDKMLDVREVFRNAKKLITYKLNTSGAKATSEVAEAKYAGIRGNDISIVVQTNVDDATRFDIITMIGTTKVDTQTVKDAASLVANNYVTFKTTKALAAGTTALSGGTNGAETGTSVQSFLDKLENYQFNALGCTSEEVTTRALYVAYTKRMRENIGAKFSLVIKGELADYEGITSVKNSVKETGESAVYWATGAEAGCAVNGSCTNKTYDGELTIVTDYTQTELEDALNEGSFIFHKQGDEVRVLQDINTLVTLTDAKTAIFQSNDTIRTIDDIATSIAALYNDSYIGKVRNNRPGRASFKNDIIKIHKDLDKLGALENYNEVDKANLTVEAGDTKGAVVVKESVTVTGAMTQLYMTTIVG